MRLGICILSLLALLLPSLPAAAQVTSGFDHVVIDGERFPFGEAVEIVGIPDTRLRRDSWLYLRVVSINGRAVRQQIECEVLPTEAISWEQLRNAGRNPCCQVQGTLTDARSGAHLKRLAVVVAKVQVIPLQTPGFAEFRDREAEFEGQAVAGGMFHHQGMTALVKGIQDWPESVVDKPILVRGTPRLREGEWQLENAVWSMARLADQIDRDVTLEGRLLSLNDHWWFESRGEKLLLADQRGRTLTLDTNDHARSARISGRLRRQLRPSLDQISLKTARDLVPCYVIHGAQLEYLDGKDPWLELFGDLSRTPYQMEEGVPLLAPRWGLRNRIGNETMALAYHAGNSYMIQQLLKAPPPKACEVLARQMRNAELDTPLRLLAAAMLEALGDDQGRELLTEHVGDPKSSAHVDALYCLAQLRDWLPPNKDLEKRLGWARPLLVERFSAPHEPAPAEFARYGPTGWDLQHAQLARVLIELDPAAANRLLPNFVRAGRGRDLDVIDVWFNSSQLVPVNLLLALEAASADVDVENAGWDSKKLRHNILSQLLRHKHPAAAERFGKDLGDWWIFAKFREYPSPEVLQALREWSATLPEGSRRSADLLFAMTEPDPVPKLLEMLDSPGADKPRLIAQLSLMDDPRAALPVLRILRNAPDNFFIGAGSLNSHLLANSGVENALEIISHSSDPQAIAELIRLLEADLSRFGTYSKGDELRSLVAATLIEMTGESFGVDAAAWRKWSESRR